MSTESELPGLAAAAELVRFHLDHLDELADQGSDAQPGTVEGTAPDSGDMRLGARRALVAYRQSLYERIVELGGQWPGEEEQNSGAPGRRMG